MPAATLRSILNAPPSVLWGSNPKYFYKSKVFATPDASAVPPLEKFMDPAFGTFELGGTTLSYNRDVSKSLFDSLSTKPVEGHWVPSGNGVSTSPMNSLSWLIVEGFQQPLSSQSPSKSSKVSSDRSVFSSIRFDACRDDVESVTTNTTCSDPNIHADGILGWPCPITLLIAQDVISLRLTGEKTSDAPPGPSIISGDGPRRMKAVAGWAAGFIYAQIAGAASTGGPDVGGYNADVHVRVTDRIYTVLESTSLPPPTVILALWYTSQLPFVVSTADDGDSRDVLYRRLGGYGTVVIEDTVFLAFILGAMLANKANDDFPLSASEWHMASLYGINDLKLLEVSALKLFGWNIVIDSVQWGRWMAYITAYHSVLARYQAISRDYGVVACVIDRVNRQDPHWNCNCESNNTSSSSSLDSSASNDTDVHSSNRSPPIHPQCQFLSRSPSLPLLDDLYDTRWQPEVGRVTYRPPQTVLTVAPGMDKEPTSWCPAADPILETTKATRTMGKAPGSTWFEPVTTLDIQENITGGHYSP